MVDEKLLLTLPYEIGDEDDLKEAGLHLRISSVSKRGQDIEVKSVLGGELGILLENMMAQPGEIDGEKMSVDDPAGEVQLAFMNVVSEVLTSGASFSSAEDIRKYLSTAVRNRRYHLLAAMDRSRRKRRIGLDRIPENERGEDAFEIRDVENLNPEEELLEKARDSMEGKLREAEFAAEQARRRARSAPLRKRGRKAARES